jgi:glycolate oxidase FAD binding subunit
MSAQGLEPSLKEPDLQPWEALNEVEQQRIDHAIAPNQAIAGVTSPQTVEALAQAVAHAHTQHWQLLPCGAQSKLDWGGLVGKVDGRGREGAGERGSKLLVLSTQRLNRLIEHAVGDLTVTVEAGMGFAELQALLAKEGQFLAIDPAYPEQATIGGIVATGDTGSLRQRYHSVRDLLLGVSFIRADGQLAKAGGRVVKNVAGYDLMKLFTGSYGTLGILTQLTFRVYPLPEASQTLVITGSAEAIAQATQTLLSSALTPTSVDLLSSPLVDALHLGTGVGLAVRFQAIAPSVTQQCDRLTEVCQALGLTVTAVGDDAALWQQFATQMTTTHANTTIFCKIGIRPTHAIALFQLATVLSNSIQMQIHAGSGLGRLTCDSTIPLDIMLKLRSFCQQHNGFLSILKAPVALKQQVDVWGYSGNAIAMMQSIKHEFDPDHRLSPGRFIGKI